MKTVLISSIHVSAWLLFGSVPAFATGTLVSWGGGQLTPSAINNVIAISTAADHTLALLSGGNVISWGYNFDLQTDVPPWLSGATAISAGEFFSVAAKSDGNVVAWGDNQFGQCEVPPLLANVTAVSAGRAHVLAKRADGSIAAWGNNDYGQCDVPPGINSVSAVLAKWNYSLALKADGTVAAWGDNCTGQTAVPPGLANVIALAGGIDFCMALRRDGTVVGWGNYPSPQFPLNGVRAIAAGEDHCLALLSNGSVVAWGGNSSGQSTVPPGLGAVNLIAAAWNYSLATTTASGLIQNFSLINPKRNGLAFSVSLLSQTGVTYSLQYRTGLNNGTWASLASVQGTGGELTLTDASASDTQRFYRVLAQ